MNPPLGITSQLTLALVGLAIVPVAAVTTLSLHSAQQISRADKLAQLGSSVFEKQVALDVWISDREREVVRLASLIDDVWAPEATPADSVRIGAQLASWTTAHGPFITLDVIDPDSGEVTSITQPNDIGKFRNSRDYFQHGTTRSYLNTPFYDMITQRIEMVVSTPIRSEGGPLRGVLAGKINLARMSQIVTRQMNEVSGIDLKLIARSRLFVAGHEG